MSDQRILGTGWGFPPTFSNGGASVGMVSGEEDIHQSLQILLTTRLGERVMNEDYGCDLREMQFEEIDSRLIGNIQRLVRDAILYHEPRLFVTSLSVDEDADQPGLLFISIEYVVRATNSRFNMVYPYYLNEAT